MIRLQKLLAEAGLGSRRAVEGWIRAGRVTVAGRIARLGDRATPGDEVHVDGRRVALSPAGAAPPELLLYYKPLGEVTTRSDPDHRPTVFDRLPRPRRGRWINVGRLDVNTTGLLLLTTDGKLAHRLMHPSSEVEREYLVRVQGHPDKRALAQLLFGLALEDGPARFDRIEAGTWDEAGRWDAAGGKEGRGKGTRGQPFRRAASHSAFRVVLHEGRNREVRRLWQAVGFEVSRLQRVRYGPIELPRGMRPGDMRPGTPALIERLRALVEPKPRSG